MQPLKILFHSNAREAEKTDCFIEHVKSHALEQPTPLTQIDPTIILAAMQTNNPIAVMCPSLRFLVEPERFTQLDCDIALFTNKDTPIGRREHIDTSFILFQPKPKTFTFLKEWITKLERMVQVAAVPASVAAFVDAAHGRLLWHCASVP